MKKTSLALLALFSLGSAALADVVYVTSCVSNCVATSVCGNGANPDINLVGNPVYLDEGGFGAYTSAKAGTADKVVVPGSRYHSNAFSNSTPDVTGILISPSLVVTGGIYKVFHVYSSTAGNVSTNLIVGFTNVEGCTISWTTTDKFQRKYGTPSPQIWQFLGYLTNNADTSYPRIRMYFVDGIVNAGAQQRLIIEQFRFQYYEPCTDVPTMGVTGPLGTNLNQVVVTGVSGAATNVTVYQDSGSGMVQIGQKTNAVIAGNNTVDVSGLVKGAQVAATQTINGQEGCKPTMGVRVGSGANPSLRLALSLRYDPTMTGPVGSPGVTSANIFYLGASDILSGAAPGTSALVVYPSNEWQTISFQRGPDPYSPISPYVLWNGSGTVLDGNFGALDGLGIACEGDTGDFDIYIDNLENGTNGLVQGWETPAPGATYGFSQPSFSGTTSGNLLTLPNSSTVVTTTSYAGHQCCRVRWQFAGEENNRWLRLVTSGNSGVANPQLELNEPISFKLLLLPPGAPVPQPAAPGTLSVNRIGNDVVLGWTGSYPLQSATNATGIYTDVGVATGPYTNAIGADDRFFRLRGN